MRPVDLAILIAYLVGVTVFGCSFYFRKNAKGTAGFVVGGGHVPSWAIGLSIFATLVSSISFLALPAKAFASNWNALVFSFTVPLAAIIAAFAFVPLYRNRRYIRRNAPDRSCVAVLRASTVTLGIASVAVAFAVIGVESALSTWWMLQSVLSGGMLGLFLLGCASKRTTSPQAVIATLVGVAAVAWVVFFQKTLHSNMSIVLGTIALFVSGLGMSLLVRRSRA